MSTELVKYNFRMQELYRVSDEMCPHCGMETVMIGRVSKCSWCGERILACNLCYPDDPRRDCANCEYEYLLEE